MAVVLPLLIDSTTGEVRQQNQNTDQLTPQAQIDYLYCLIKYILIEIKKVEDLQGNAIVNPILFQELQNAINQ